MKKSINQTANFQNRDFRAQLATRVARAGAELTRAQNAMNKAVESKLSNKAVESKLSNKDLEKFRDDVVSARNDLRGARAVQAAGHAFPPVR